MPGPTVDDRLRVTYRLVCGEGETPQDKARDIAYEQTVELPPSCVGEAITERVVGRVEEVAPGSAKDPLEWEVFLEAVRDIGYDGLLSHEQCSPIVIKGHKLGTVQTIDERYIEAILYLKGLLLKLGCYTGHKDISIAEKAEKEFLAGA